MSLHSFTTDFANKKVLIFGLGLLGGGESVVKFLQEIGCTLRITDQKTEQELLQQKQRIGNDHIDRWTLGQHDQADIEWAEVIIKNPAVPYSQPLIQQAIEQGKQVTTEAALFLKYAEGKTIGITGTRGKTTTTGMIHHLLKHSGVEVTLGGNIQDTGTLTLLKEDRAEVTHVVELSSFALEGVQYEKVSPHFAVLTNLYPDHLNRYDSLEQYADAKAAIFQHQHSTDHIFLNADDTWTPYFLRTVHSSLHLVSMPDLPKEVRLQVPGEHNRMNAAFAYTVGQQLGLTKEQLTAGLESFTGMPFRLQKIGTIDSKTIINDSTSTTPAALLTALKTFPEATLIIGGTTKKIDLGELAQQLAQHQGNIIFLKGSGTTELLTALQETHFTQSTEQYNNLADTLRAALSQTPQNGTIVFSPGFTSFELFKNEFDRAQQFNQLVTQWKQ